MAKVRKTGTPGTGGAVKETGIGTTDNTGGGVSRKGPQWPFLPGSESHANAGVTRRSVGNAGGSNKSDPKPKWPFLPDKP